MRTHEPSGLTALAHEMRGHLAVISTAVEALSHPPLVEPVLRHNTHLIERQTRQISRLIEDTLARANGQEAPLRPRSTDVREALHEVLRMSLALPESAGRDVRLELGDQPLRADVDEDLIVEALVNLVCNACKFSDPGGRVDVRAWRSDDEVLIAVVDTGIGLTTDEQRALFSTGFRSRAPRAQGRAGHGVGLAIVKRTVELHGGSVVATSAGPGRGSTFLVRLPSTLRTASAPSPETVAPCSALVVEDYPELAEVFGAALRLRGADVRLASQGGTALALAAEARSELTFVDLGLPDMEGLELGRRLRALDGTTLLVALTGRCDRTGAELWRSAGFDRYLVKPISGETIDELLRCVEARRASAATEQDLLARVRSASDRHVRLVKSLMEQGERLRASIAKTAKLVSHGIQRS